MAEERNVAAEDRRDWEGRPVKGRGWGRCVKDRDWEDETCLKKVGREDAATRGDYKSNFAR